MYEGDDRHVKLWLSSDRDKDNSCNKSLYDDKLSA